MDKVIGRFKGFEIHRLTGKEAEQWCTGYPELYLGIFHYAVSLSPAIYTAPHLSLKSLQREVRDIYNRYGDLYYIREICKVLSRSHNPAIKAYGTFMFPDTFRDSINEITNRGQPYSPPFRDYPERA